MGIQKKILHILTISVFVFLVFCTFFSIHAADSARPVVEVAKPARMTLTVNGKPARYGTVVPSEAVIPGAVVNKGYVYIIRQRQGLFGVEDYAKLIEVEIIAADDGHTAISDLIVSKSDDVVVSSSRYLTPGETVKVNAQN